MQGVSQSISDVFDSMNSSPMDIKQSIVESISNKSSQFEKKKVSDS